MDPNKENDPDDSYQLEGLLNPNISALSCAETRRNPPLS